MKVNEAIEIILQFIRSVNKYLEVMAPWKLVKSDKDFAGKVLFTDCPQRCWQASRATLASHVLTSRLVGRP